MTQLATIGYEGATLADFIPTLLATGAERLIDVRALAQSRRSGFSKKSLQTALAEADIDYYHIPQLGDPKSGREAARAGHFDLFRAIFNDHINLPASREALTYAVMLVLEKQSALMCFERDHTNCHRSIVAEYIAGLSPMRVENLTVHKGLQESLEHGDTIRGANGARRR